MAASKQYDVYPVGTPGKPWGEAEKREWLSRQSKKRDYFNDVVSALARISSPAIEVFQYGELDYRKYGAAKFPLMAARSHPFVPTQPLVVVTGGVHGYETSGIHGALLFIQQNLEAVAKRGVNVLVLPCISPWGYEMIHRWTPEAVDPNRQFDSSNPGCPEAAAAMPAIQALVAQSSRILCHVDLHETTDSDNSEFEPTRIARDGLPNDDWHEVPDGFYLVGDSSRPEPEFQKTMIDAVEKITHIAPPDEKGNIIGVPLAQRGVINYPGKGLCGVHTAAKFVTTTEVYPDSPNATPEECNRAQAACAAAGIDYALAHSE